MRHRYHSLAAGRDNDTTNVHLRMNAEEVPNYTSQLWPAYIYITCGHQGPVGVIVTSDAGFRARFKKKAIKMLGLVVILFLVCWTPLLTFDLVVKVDGHIHVSSTLIHVKYYLQVSVQFFSLQTQWIHFSPQNLYTYVQTECEHSSSPELGIVIVFECNIKRNVRNMKSD